MASALLVCTSMTKLSSFHMGYNCVCPNNPLYTKLNVNYFYMNVNISGQVILLYV